MYAQHSSPYKNVLPKKLEKTKCSLFEVALDNQTALESRSSKGPFDGIEYIVIHGKMVATKNY